MTVDRGKLLEAAARVYGEYGFRGATTRRIADEAGVNEITIFRQFGSKEALINEALQCQASRSRLPQLPAVPEDPARELTEWCVGVLSRMTAARSLILRMMGELVERPEVAPCAAEGRLHAMRELDDYVQRLRHNGWWTENSAPRLRNGRVNLSSQSERISAAPLPPLPRGPEDEHDLDASTPEIDRYAAVSMLISALFSDAMGRQIMPDAYPQPADQAAAKYSRLFLRALGVRSPSAPHPAVHSAPQST